MGKASSDFEKAAQRKVNLTWLFLIVAGAVWYFTDWIWALIPAAAAILFAIQSISANLISIQMEKTEDTIRQPIAETEGSDDFLEIVQKYGRTLEFDAPTPGSVADLNKLPYPKQKIKEALIQAMKITSDPQIKDHLKIAFISLADWQEGVGGEDIGFDFSKPDFPQDIIKRAERTSEIGDEVMKWMQISELERQQLTAELERLSL